MKTPEPDPVYELKSKILKAAFKQEKFKHPQSSEIIEMHTKLYVYNSFDSSGRKTPIPIGCRKNIKHPEYNKGVIIGLNIDTLSDLYALSFKMDSFAHELSEIIWHCMEERDPEWAKKLLTEIEQSYIAGMKHLSKKHKHNKATRDKYLSLERKHAKKEVAKIRKTVDFNYSQNVHHWIEEDNVAINKAYLLYMKHLPELTIQGSWLSRKIISSLAIVFAVADFWIDKQNDVNREKIYAEKIKDRLRSIKNEIQQDSEAHEACLYDDLPQKNIQKD